ncbi:pyridoxamine 5'-phosphate oxidase family protein [Rhodovarius crocodyli]|uniref:Pyridoxamine 5'-phosphate oxidase family protein n=1 Tax=Rhodovarius crocodyli TaxID=1979269 RepID=A0A437MGN6_9PROT|nr:pyridoxamine 5'-phosphate oxidase family protein [Rhodovarius crocodyli]RVT96804.1 pyridoxamine 5'-phosphate oxidase family protein [Rhodovarius crocodyli]
MPTERTRVRRRPERGHYDRATIDAILDEALLCHVGVVVDGEPFVIPTTIVREGDWVYLHGSPKNRLLTTIAAGAAACITVTLVDSIVAGRSGFGMSMDYRSVVIFAHGEVIDDPAEKNRLVYRFVEAIIPGHQVRPAKPQELNATLFLRFPIEEASAKIRDVGVVDPEEDQALDLWAGVVPLKLVAGEPRPCPALKPGTATPDYAKGWKRP